MISGTLDPAALAPFPFPAAREMPDTFVVQATWELAGVDGPALLPPALHPTAPLLVSMIAIDGHAEVRLSCRHGARARALVIGTTDQVSFDGTRLRAGDAELSIGEAARSLGPADVQYVTSLWPVVVDGRGLRLVQQEWDVEPRSVARHVVSVSAWPAAWPAPATLVGLSVARGAVSLPAPRFMARPDVLAFEGSERV